MKRVWALFLVISVSSLAFAETVFIPHIGLDVIKFVNDKKFDNFMSSLVNKGLDRNKNPGELVEKISAKDVPQSNPHFASFTIGLDMRFTGKSGFTFYWNNMFSIADRFKAKQYGHFIKGAGPGGSDKLFLHKEKRNEKFKLMLYSTEFLFGATYFRTKALTINFGLGLKFAISPLIGTISNLKKDYFAEQMGLNIISALGGTFGVSYYFNDIVGLSVSLSDFMGIGFFAFEKTKQPGTKLKDALVFTAFGFTNDFSVKFGVNLRVKGKLEK